MSLNSHAAENAARTDDELDRQWARCFGRHPSDVWCPDCEQSLLAIRRARLQGVVCSCRDPDGQYCDLHDITLCN